MDNALLPIELFQRIIDQLSAVHDNGRVFESPSLRACSLVCKAFVPLCQWHLFHDIHLGIHNNTSISRARLIGILEINPALCSFIKQVTYSLYLDEEQKLRYPQCYLDHLPSIYEGGYSVSLHELLPAIHTLRFNWHEHNDDEWSRPWPLYARQCCEQQIDCKDLFNIILQDFAGSPTITSFEISFFRISLPDIFVFPALQHFKSNVVDWTPFDTPIRKQFQHALHLKSLDLTNQGSFPFRILDYCPDIEHLRVGVSPLTGLNCLSLQDVSAIIPDGLRKVVTYEKLRSVNTSHIGALAYLCKTAETMDVVALPSLNRLTVFFHTWNNGMGEPAALRKVMRHAPNLRSLSLSDINAFSSQFLRKTSFDTCFQERCGTILEHISLTYRCEAPTHPGHPASIHMLCDALSYIKTNNQLKTIHLHLSIFEGRVDDWMKNTVCEWGRLDGMLTANGGSDFPHLMKIAVSVKVEHGSNQSASHIILPGFRATLQEGWAQSLSLLHAAFEASILHPEALSWNHELVLIRRKL